MKEGVGLAQSNYFWYGLGGMRGISWTKTGKAVCPHQVPEWTIDYVKDSTPEKAIEAFGNKKPNSASI
jgi:hypothetical protein